MASPSISNTNECSWTLQSIRKLLKRLISNRKRAWQYAGFNVQSKQRALDHFNTQFEAARNWKWDGHIFLLYDLRETIKDILPGEESSYQLLRAEVKEFLEWLISYHNSKFPHRATN